MYLTVTRPDITYAVHVVSQFVSAPTSVHWAAVVRILRYLRGSMFHSLLLFPTLPLMMALDFYPIRFPTDSNLPFQTQSLLLWNG